MKFDKNSIARGLGDEQVENVFDDFDCFSPLNLEPDVQVASHSHLRTVPLRDVESSLGQFDLLSNLISSEDIMIKSLLNQLTYLCVCNGYRQGTISDLERFEPNAKLAEINSITLLAAIFGSDLIMDELARHLKCGPHEIVFPQAVYEMRQALRENFVTRTYAKKGENTDYDWFHHVEPKRAELKFDFEAKSEIRMLLNVVMKTNELVLDIQRLAEIIETKSKHSATSRNFIELNTQNRHMKDEFRRVGALNQLESRLNKRVFGQSEAISAITSLLGSSFGKSKKEPLGIATFVGQPDSGKTMLAETFCNELNQAFRLGFQLTVFNMEQFCDDKSSSKLLGSGSQYVNSSLGDITAPIFVYPRQIIVLDEIEKAHPTAIQSLLTILGKGEMRDATNRRLSRYNQCIFILTSNLGQKLLNKASDQNVKPDLDSVLADSGQNFGLSPELISRLKSGYVGQFKALSPLNLLRVAGEEFEKFKRENISPKICWPECFPELVVLSLAGDASPRAIKARFGTLKTEIMRFGLGKVIVPKKKFNITGVETAEKLRIAVFTNDAVDQEINFSATGVEIIKNDCFKSIIEMHKQQSFDAIFTFEGSNCFIEDEQADFGKLPIFLLMNYEFTQPHHDAIPYHRVIPKSLQKQESYSSIFDIVAKTKLIMRLMPELKRRRSKATYEIQHFKHNDFEEIQIGNFKYEQTFDPKDFDNHYVKMPVKPDITLDDLLDGSELKQQLIQVNTSIKRQLWNQLDFPRGILLSGPPGSGKTHAAKALAGSCNLYFFQVNAADLTIGDVVANINHLFDLVSSAAPAILFIDELDSIACERSNASQGMRIAVNTLLTRLDGFQKATDPVIVIGATNLVQMLDPALLRAGRLEQIIHVPLPNLQQRKEIIEGSLKKYNLPVNPGELEFRAQQSHGMTLKAIQNCFRDLALKRLCEDEQSTKVQSSLVASQEQNRQLQQIAIHEAGHVVSIKMGNSDIDVEYVWIVHHPELGGITKTNDIDLSQLTRERLETMVQHKLAGRAAEELILGNSEASAGAAQDFRDATELVRKGFFEFGMSDKYGYADFSQLPTVQASMEGEVVQFMNNCYRKVREKLNGHKDIIKRISNELYVNRRLSKEELNWLIGEESSIPKKH